MQKKCHKRKHPDGMTAPSAKRSVSFTRSSRRTAAPSEYDKIKDGHRKAVSALYQAYETLTFTKGSDADDSASAKAAYAVLLEGTNGALSHKKTDLLLQMCARSVLHAAMRILQNPGPMLVE